MSCTETTPRHQTRAAPSDREIARRTLPAARTGVHDPSVDPDVWLDHVLYAEHEDRDVLERLVREYDRYARSLASRMARHGELREDLDQVALEALVVALGRFDPGRRLPFPGYATPTILGALRRHYRDRGWLLRVPRYVHELTTGAYATSQRLTMELGRMPTVVEVAVAMGVAVDDLLGAQEAVRARNAESLDAQTVDGLGFASQVGADDPNLALTDDRVALAAALETVDDLSRGLLRLYYFEGMTQSDIGTTMGMSQMQVSRLLARTLKQLRAEMLVA